MASRTCCFSDNKILVVLRDMAVALLDVWDSHDEKVHHIIFASLRELLENADIPLSFLVNVSSSFFRCFSDEPCKDYVDFFNDLLKAFTDKPKSPDELQGFHSLLLPFSGPRKAYLVQYLKIVGHWLSTEFLSLPREEKTEEILNLIGRFFIELLQEGSSPVSSDKEIKEQVAFSSLRNN